MAIFTERDIVRMLGGVRSSIGNDDYSSLLGRLTGPPGGVLLAEWELAILFALIDSGSFEPVPIREKVKRPDAIFLSHRTGERLVVEVTAISDAMLVKRNPVHELSSRLHGLLKRIGNPGNGAIDLIVGEARVKERNDRLAVPSWGDLDRFLTSNVVKGFFRGIKHSPYEERSLEFVKRGGTSTIIYRPGTEVSHGSHAWYRGLDSIDKNIVVEVLREKADQIRSSGLRFPAVAILCDADCAALQSTMMPDYSGMTIERTLLRFFTGEAGPPPPRLNGWRANPPRTSRLNGAFVLSISENFPLDAQKRGRTLCFRYCQNSGDTMFKMTDETAQSYLSASIGYPHQGEQRSMPSTC
jgi:hypothetical protein